MDNDDDDICEADEDDEVEEEEEMDKENEEEKEKKKVGELTIITISIVANCCRAEYRQTVGLNQRKISPRRFQDECATRWAICIITSP
ncbi:hypothetical protein PoB_002484400 [Plakobranchus ocellatus]|uniref:Uncharacterized protein n=1 Tax=Plakobranchus ocellatus TaxID=259542 RepID=A0AAV3ZSL5_9GAST|nr:hypothetical protein PoB_002484400 [Plakobranchus ocellatus]